MHLKKLTAALLVLSTFALTACLDMLPIAPAISNERAKKIEKIAVLSAFDNTFHMRSVELFHNIKDSTRDVTEWRLNEYFSNQAIQQIKQLGYEHVINVTPTSPITPEDLKTFFFDLYYREKFDVVVLLSEGEISSYGEGSETSYSYDGVEFAMKSQIYMPIPDGFGFFVYHNLLVQPSVCAFANAEITIYDLHAVAQDKYFVLDRSSVSICNPGGSGISTTYEHNLAISYAKKANDINDADFQSLESIIKESTAIEIKKGINTILPNLDPPQPRQSHRRN